jgi:hypothetical protein
VKHPIGDASFGRLNIMTFSIIIKNATLSIVTLSIMAEHCYAERHLF